MRIVFSADGNATLAQLLSNAIDLAADDALNISLAPSLQQQWGPSGGAVILHLVSWRSISVQLRPELARPAALLDPRVRQALAFGIDRAAFNETLYSGNSPPADSPIPRQSTFGVAVAQTETPYPYDPRQSQARM